MNSARKTKRKLKLKLTSRRKAGSHRKSQAALRRAEKMALKKQLPDQ
jgi:hypothetical protein